jgi:DNA-binding IclR family transcriptional regulator
MHLAEHPAGCDAAELALRIGCGAERVRGHLEQMERDQLVRRLDTPFGPRWSA